MEIPSCLLFPLFYQHSRCSFPQKSEEGFPLQAAESSMVDLGKDSSWPSIFHIPPGVSWLLWAWSLSDEFSVLEQREKKKKKSGLEVCYFKEECGKKFPSTPKEISKANLAFHYSFLCLKCYFLFQIKTKILLSCFRMVVPNFILLLLFFFHSKNPMFNQN